MPVLYLDLIGGIAGDMLAAALVELGVPLEAMRKGIAAVGLQGVRVETRSVFRHEITATHFRVINTLDDSPADAAPQKEVHTHEPDHTSSSEHSHEHEQQHKQQHETHDDNPHSHGNEPHHHHGHDHTHEDGPGHHHEGPQHAAHHHEHRAWRDIDAMLLESSLTPGAKKIARRAFSLLADAEGRIHGIAPEEVRFHEVGAWDSIADIVACAVGLDWLQPEAVLVSPVPLGSGTVRTAHGVMPIPAPATLLLLKGLPLLNGGAAFERTTPTGAALLAAVARPTPEPFAYTPRKVGHGAGTKDPAAVANLLRAVLADSPNLDTASNAATGAPSDLPWQVEQIECAEVNLDDANPEWIGYLFERLLGAGALDVVLLPVQMKKNRPGTLVQVLYLPERRNALLHLLFEETTTLGVRYRSLERAILPRQAHEVTTPWGPVAGKIAWLGGVARFAPEYEACAQAARQASVPLREVYKAAQEAFAAPQGAK